VFQALVNRKALVPVDPDQRADQILGGVADFPARGTTPIRGPADVRICTVCPLTIKEVAAHQHHIEDNTKGPEVSRLVVS